MIELVSVALSVGVSGVRKQWKRCLGASLAALLTMSGQSVGAAVTYTIQDLGTGWIPTGINDSGYIIGNMVGQGGALNVVTWQYGCLSNCLTNLGDFGSGWASANSVNNLGQIVGGYRLADFSQHAFLYDSSGLKDLSTLGGQISEAYGVNNLGQVVGQSYLQNGGYTAFIYQNGAMQDLGVSQVFNQSQATGINDAGLVIGVANPQFGQWTLGMTIDSANGNSLTTINPPSANPGVFLSAVNSSGAVVGYGYGNTTEAFIYAGGQITPVAGQYVSQAFDINDQGQSVGYASNAAGNGLYLNDGQAVTMWQDLIDQNLGWSISAATGAFNINNAGQIVGVASLGGQQHVFLMTPNVPNPVDALAPTNLQLAQMSRDAYSEYPNTAVGAFQIIGTKGVEGDANNVFAQAYISGGVNGGRPQIVIAIRGSIALEDFELRNGTFFGSGATVEYKQGAIDVADFIGVLRTQFPNADFTLTGHSLGGALAQSVAEQIGVNAVGFNAPGAKGLLTGISDSLKNSVGGQVFSSTQDLQTIRAYGDEISKIGANYGGLYTDIKTVGLLPDGIANRAAIDAVGGLCAYLCHRMDSLYDALAAGQIYEIGISDSVPSPNLPVAGIVASLNALKQFNLAVGARIFPLDPSGIGDLIEIQMLDSDVYVTGMILPAFEDSFPVWYFEGDQWLSLGQYQGYQEFSVPISSAYRIGNADVLKGETGAFALGMRFSSVGTFRGTIGLVDSSVPEPQTWGLFILGFGFIGFVLRGNRSHKLLNHS